MRNIFICFLLTALIAPITLEAQFWKKKKKPEPVVEVKKEEPKKKETKIKKYEEIIPKDAVTDSGLVQVHKVNGDFYFEFPKSVLGKEMLITSRISGFVKNLNFGGAGVESRPQQVVRWQLKDDVVYLRSVSYNSVADFEDPIYRSVVNNNFEPVIMSFEVKTYGKDSSAVIDIKPLFTTDVEMIGAMSDSQRKTFGIKSLDSKRSFIERIRSFPQNLNVKHVLTYTGSSLPDNQITGTLSVEMTQSFVLLPDDKMMPRLYDDRVSYFSIQQTNYSLDEQRAGTQRFITRWRLEPRDEDRERYFKGELVEPKKPIVYYIDPATPEKWRPYLKQGVNDWQSAFEAAGFKNAIYAKDPPTHEEDPDFDPEDIRYSVIRYVSTDIQNAMGPHVHDPRTGEIIESDIIWYHNVMNLLRNWFFVQTAAINPEARSVKFRDEVMGRLIRFVAAHEVGHTLGLPHNMGSSSAYPVDSLRSPHFTKLMGTAPSIMDYARFNYVAQPGDGDVGLMPDIGPYDVWSIVFGYRLIPDVKTPFDERSVINKWIKEKADDPIYRFGRQRGLALDPTAQTEDLGDDAMHASELGIKNLQRIVPNLIEWTKEETKNYEHLRELYGQVLGQFGRYMGHVTANLGGVYEKFRSADEDKPVYIHIDREKQKRAVKFLNDQLFTTPVWYLNPDIISRTEENGGAEKIRAIQENTLKSVFSPDRLKRVTENMALNGDKAYAITELYDDVSKSVMSEFAKNQKTDIYRRNLHRTFVDVLGQLMTQTRSDIKQSDIQAATRATLTDLKKLLQAYRNTDVLSKHHAADLLERLELILNPKGS